jgi:hypothetical protein
VVFEPTITMFERQKTVHALYHTTTVTGRYNIVPIENSKLANNLYGIVYCHSTVS